MPTPRISISQWQAFVSVVESGGYAQAAEHLHKSQSSITYAVQKLENLLGVAVLTIEGRKAVLTPAGRVLYRRGRALLDQAAKIEHAAANLARGWEAEVHLAVDAIFPTWLLLEAIARFDEEQPDIRVELVESVLAGTEEALSDGRTDFVITSMVPPGFLGDPLMAVPFVAAAHPDHPLHRLGRPVSTDDLARHRHIVVRDTGVHSNRSVGGWFGERRLTVSHKATSIRAASMGLGFAWYARDTIREELDAGLLVPLPLREGGTRMGMLYLVFADADGTGPGALRLAEIIRTAVASACQAARDSAAGGPG